MKWQTIKYYGCITLAKIPKINVKMCHLLAHQAFPPNYYNLSRTKKTARTPTPISTRNRPPHDKTNKMTCAPSEDSDQPHHPPSLIRVFAVRMKKAWVVSYLLSAQRRLWSDWANAQADLSLRWAHRSFCWFCHGAARMPQQKITALLWHLGIKKKSRITWRWGPVPSSRTG